MTAPSASPHSFDKLALSPATLANLERLGYLEMTDGGKPDYKLISVVDCDPRYSDYYELEELPDFILKEIRNFFENYKVLQGVNVTTGAYRGKEDAIKIIEECTERYKQAVEG